MFGGRRADEDACVRGVWYIWTRSQPVHPGPQGPFSVVVFVVYQRALESCANNGVPWLFSDTVSPLCSPNSLFFTGVLLLPAPYRRQCERG